MNKFALRHSSVADTHQEPIGMPVACAFADQIAVLAKLEDAFVKIPMQQRSCDAYLVTHLSAA
jgi:hypothetical protein